GFGSFVIYEARGLPYHSEFGPGPGFFPLWIGVGIVACSLFLMGAAIVRGGTLIPISRVEMVRALSAWVAFVLAVALLPLVGFGLSLALLTAFLVLVLDRRSPWVAIGVAVGLALGFHVVFALALGVSLPAGPWGF
ncbi:MAG TPA: tripartite tricarboxylate transporter TctB family protein, partial [Candidatus Binatia bacterium]